MGSGSGASPRGRLQSRPSLCRMSRESTRERERVGNARDLCLGRTHKRGLRVVGVVPEHAAPHHLPWNNVRYHHHPPALALPGDALPQVRQALDLDGELLQVSARWGGPCARTSAGSGRTWGLLRRGQSSGGRKDAQTTLMALSTRGTRSRASCRFIIKLQRSGVLSRHL